ncbi:multicopper ferroxidase [Micractinium conductrix]|uniref:Multicopper ferroxidase n=1 Tax=Micractinium conductrix TaxID=554055 RepID=A0A2P6VD81_9CHLO|nr:multicopper ferroxidase [Micractinium conductrix]|eukprot:PSC72045.1 multicopper ferroxidase [Micractinium conductrix]
MRGTRGTGAHEALARWWDSPWRKETNERAATFDRTGHIFGAVSVALLLSLKTWLREGLPLLALQASTQVLLSSALVFLTSSKAGRALYVRYRELYALLYVLDMQRVVRLTALHGGYNTISNHKGSALMLLVLMAGHTSTLYTVIFALFTRLAAPASAVLLAVTAAVSLLHSPRMCVRVLESDGVAPVLGSLHRAMSLVHGGATPPGVFEVLSTLVRAPQQQCLVLSGWLTVMLGFVFPVLLLRRVERKARRWYEARQPPGSPGEAALRQGGARRRQREQQRLDASLPSRGIAPALQLYVVSSLTSLLMLGGSSRRQATATCLVLLAAAAAGVPAAAEQPGGPTYYIAADQISWDYAPSGVNLCSGEEFNSNLWTELGVGRKYTKAQYRQYSDDSFQTLVPKPEQDEHTGLLGPVLRAAVGQVLTIVLKNNVNFPINLVPAGLEVYQPASDAAELATTAPGTTVTYRFLVPAEVGPSPGEPSAKLWLYRSTVDLVADANAGLLGPLLVSNTPEVNTGDVAAGQERDIITILQILNEAASPFLDANLANRTAVEMGVTDAGLAESHLKHAINGYVFCNTPGMVMNQTERVRWHMASIGSETDMHNLHLHGNTWLYNGRRADHFSMLPGTVRSVQFSTDNAGFWLMHCHVADHITAGMKAMYMVRANEDLPTLAGTKPEGGVVRRYFIEAEEVVWDFAPLGGNMCSGDKQPWTPEEAVFTEATHLSLGSKFTKAHYVEYTDDTFTTKKFSDPSLGFLGPTIRAEVGDTIEVVFKNDLRFPATVHPHGVAYLKSSEGSPYFDGTMGEDTKDDMVQPGAVYTYTWQVQETSGPGPQDASTVVWMYHSHTNEVSDVYAGLVGAIIIGQKGALDEGLAAKDVDREVVLFFGVVNEVHSLYANVNAQAMGFTTMEAWEQVAEASWTQGAALEQQLALSNEQLKAKDNNGTAAPAPAGRRLLEEEEEEGYEEPMLKHVINGFLYCNMPVLTFTQGERVRFHIMSLGTEVDLHTPNFEGQTMETEGQRGAAVGMMPGAMHSMEVTMANPGVSVLQCRVADHISAGMRALVSVTASEQVAAEQDKAAAAAVVKKYFVAAEEVEWDYVPLGLDGCTNSTFGPDAQVFVAKTNATIGSKFTKAAYRAYTDATFKTKAPAPAFEGILGPTMLVEVGQTLEIVFLNRLAFPANIMLDGGLELLPAGAVAGADTSVQVEAPVAPGANQTYRYYVPESAGPGDEDFSTVAYTYTSSVDLVAHPNAGLVGALVVAAPGSLQTNSVPTGVTAMVPLLFTIMDESISPYLPQNLEAAGLGLAATYDPAWGESNLKHVINGYLYCNLPGLAAKKGDTVRYVLLGMGSEADMHSPVFTGQVLRRQTRAMHTAELMPTVVQEVDVEMVDAGSFDLYCLVHDHYTAGMRATLTVA